MMRYLLHDVFTENCRKTPDATAIVNEDGSRLTYADVNALSNRFATIIAPLKSDIRQKPFVGIISPVHAASIAAVLGTLKLGCAYVPLDEYSPTERLAKIIDNTKLDVLCVDSNLYAEHAALFDHPHIGKVILLNGDVAVASSPKNILFRVDI